MTDPDHQHILKRLKAVLPPSSLSGHKTPSSLCELYLVGVVVDAAGDEYEGEVDGGDEGGEVGHPHPHLASQLALLQNISLVILLKTSNV